MESFQLLVTNDFAQYKRGDIVKDAADIEAILASINMRNVVRIKPEQPEHKSKKH